MWSSAIRRPGSRKKNQRWKISWSLWKRRLAKSISIMPCSHCSLQTSTWYIILFWVLFFTTGAVAGSPYLPLLHVQPVGVVNARPVGSQRVPVREGEGPTLYTGTRQPEAVRVHLMVEISVSVLYSCCFGLKGTLHKIFSFFACNKPKCCQDNVFWEFWFVYPNLACYKNSVHSSNSCRHTLW